jgi:hypothetical protein
MNIAVQIILRKFKLVILTAFGLLLETVKASIDDNPNPFSGT